MNYGLYLSASGMLTGMYRMDVLAANLANSETPGFKPVMASVRQRDAAATEDSLPFLPSDKMLERLGGGVMLMPNRISMAQGAAQTTGRTLDVALDGDGFLVVGAGNSGNPAAVRFTRDGRFSVNPQRQLVQASSGLPVLDDQDRPITLTGSGPVSIDRTGRVSQGATVVARLQVATLADNSVLRPAGAGLLAAPAATMTARRPGSAMIIQSAVERSAVDAIRTVVDLSAAERAVGSNARMIQASDQLLDRAINVFGRVA